MNCLVNGLKKRLKMRQITTNNGYGIVYGYLPGRKKPVLALKFDNKIKVLASFNSQIEMEQFDDCMALMLKSGICLIERDAGVWE